MYDYDEEPARLEEEDRIADESWQAYKDNVAMGYIDKDGNQLDPPYDGEWAPDV